MRWRTYVGVALALLVVAAGSFWLGTREPFADRPAPQSSQQPAPVVAVDADKAPPAVSAGASSPRLQGAGAVPAPEQLSEEERRKRTAQVRSEMSALLAQGGSVSPERAMALIDELERLSPGGAEVAHFRSLKSMLENTSKIQALNAELQRMSGSTAPEHVARRQAILAELRQLGERIAATAAEIQTRVPGASAAGSGR